MKKILISVLIPYLFFYLTGCYSLQEVSKEELSPGSKYAKLKIKTDEREYTFNQGNYSIKNDSISGKGKYILFTTADSSNSTECLFEGSLGLSDVRGVQIEEINEIGTFALLLGCIVIVGAAIYAIIIASTFQLDFPHTN